LAPPPSSPSSVPWYIPTFASIGGVVLIGGIAGGVWWLRRSSLKAAEITRGLNDADGIPMIEDKGL